VTAPASLDSTPSARKTGLAELAQRASQGDTEATAALLRALAPQMIRSVHALMGRSHADADDAVQQSLIALVQALPAFRGECSIGHYASRIVARTVVAARRRATLRSDRREEGIDVDAMESGTSQHEDVLAERRRGIVRELLTTLPEEQAETFALRVAMGFSLPEVASATGAPLNTVRSRIRLAKEALRRRIDADPRMLELLEAES
jgi:RNA polymerase sigma factor (sigma-70 family)